MSPPKALLSAMSGESLDGTLQRLKSSGTQGLSDVEARRRLEEDGPNEFKTVLSVVKVMNLLRGALNPLVLILLFAGTVSAFLGESTSAWLIAGIVLLSAILNVWQTFRSASAAKRLRERITQTASVLRQGAWREIPRREVVVGDIVRLTAGDLVPADARLVQSRDLHVQQAALTGESFPVEKDTVVGSLGEKNAESPGLVYLGTSIVSGVATAVIFATGEDTVFGDIVERIGASPDETEFERGTRKFGLLILKTVLFLVFFILIINIVFGRNAIDSLLFSLALAVGLTPEFLPMITTVTFAQGALRMAREKVIVKHLSAIQNLGSMDILCSDKTGTLTQGKMVLQGSREGTGQESPAPLFLFF